MKQSTKNVVPKKEILSRWPTVAGIMLFFLVLFISFSVSKVPVKPHIISSQQDLFEYPITPTPPYNFDYGLLINPNMFDFMEENEKKMLEDELNEINEMLEIERLQQLYKKGLLWSA
jgi:hypothetical protein